MKLGNFGHTLNVLYVCVISSKDEFGIKMVVLKAILVESEENARNTLSDRNSLVLAYLESIL